MRAHFSLYALLKDDKEVGASVDFVVHVSKHSRAIGKGDIAVLEVITSHQWGRFAVGAALTTHHSRSFQLATVEFSAGRALVSNLRSVIKTSRPRSTRRDTFHIESYDEEKCIL